MVWNQNSTNNAAATVQETITQTAHGFSVGNVLRLSGASTYTLALADSAFDAEIVGIVSSVINANVFVLTVCGYVTGLSGLTAATTYFLSPTTAGALTSTQPSAVGQVSLPLLNADTTTSGYFNIGSGVVITAAPTATGTGAYVLQNSPTITAPIISQINNPTTAGTQIKGRTDGSFATSGNIGENILSFQGINFNYTCTMTIATPCVVTLAAHGLSTGCAVHFSTTGALPTGLTAGTTYYVINISSSTFQLATSVPNAWTGTAVATSGTQSGTQTVYHGVKSSSSGTSYDITGYKPGIGTWLCWTTNCWLSDGTSTVYNTVSGLVKNTSANPYAFMNTSSFYLNGLTYTTGNLILAGTSPTLITTNATDIVYVGNTVFFTSGGSVTMNTSL